MKALNTFCNLSLRILEVGRAFLANYAIHSELRIFVEKKKKTCLHQRKSQLFLGCFQIF